jgi:hypothetical protein
MDKKCVPGLRDLSSGKKRTKLKAASIKFDQGEEHFLLDLNKRRFY